MGSAFPILTVLAAVPLVGGLVTFFLPRSLGRLVGLLAALAALGLGIRVAASDDAFATDHAWIGAIGAHWALGVDGMARAMVLLTVAIVPLVLLAEWRVDETPGARWSSSTFFALALVLEAFALVVFMAQDVLVFYVFFEATLLPTYFLISGWGGADRASAALKMLVYNLAGGLVMLFGVIGVGAHTAGHGHASFLIGDIAAQHIGGHLGHWLFLAFFVAFVVKAPMVPVHTWLPDAAEQATPGTSTLLVGILDKIGTFGMIRLCLTMFPEAGRWAAPAILVLALVSIFWGAFMALASRNLMRLVSFTSVSHFGFMVLGIFAFTTQSIAGSVFYMVNHGFSTALLFLAVGFIVQRRGSADISAFGGVQRLAPVAAGMFLLGGLSAAAMPGMSTFVSEFLVMAGAWQRHPVDTAIACLCTVLAALYALLAYQRTMTGPVTAQAADAFTGRDLTLRERGVTMALLAVLLVFGFYPRPMMHLANPTAQATMQVVGMSDPAPRAVEGGK